MSFIRVLDLKPTQFAMAMREVEDKVKKFRDLKKDDLKDFLRDRAVPVVIDASKNHYLIDHHHLARAAWEVGIDEICVEILKDLSDLPASQFWERMKKENWVYLHDQFGQGPHDPEYLPVDIRGLADDPFRSLAWALRENKGFEKSSEPFSEFQWAEFLRKHIAEHPTKMGFHKALDAALELSRKAEAKALPGYVGDKKGK